MAEGTLSDLSIDVGGVACSLAEISGLGVQQGDITGVVELGEYLFNHDAVVALKEVGAAAYLAARAEARSDAGAFPQAILLDQPR